MSESASNRETIPEGMAEQYRLLMECAADYALVPLDSAGRVAEWNAGAERILGYEGGGRYSSPVLDDGPVEYGRSGSDQTTITDPTAFQMRVVADYAAVSNSRRPRGGGVDDGAVLHRGQRADVNGAVVASQHGAGPD